MPDRAWDGKAFAMDRIVRQSMEEAFRGTVGHEPAADDVFTMEKLLEATRLLGYGPGRRGAPPLAPNPVLTPRYRIITSDALTVTEPRIDNRQLTEEHVRIDPYLGGAGEGYWSFVDVTYGTEKVRIDPW